MTPERLSRILETYGAEPSRWPAAERDDALALLARDESVARQAFALDRTLDRFAVPCPDAAMFGRALAGFAALAPDSLLHRWWLAPLLAGAGALGIAAGTLLLALMPPRHDAVWPDEHSTIFGAPVDPGEVSL